MNLLYVDLFNEMMRELPRDAKRGGKPFLPVYCLMDEFGHTSIPNFATVATTIRKYDVSLSVVLQNFSQLVAAYGPREAQTIIEGGMTTRLFYPGLPNETARLVEQLLGREVVKERRMDGSVHRREHNLLNADRIRTLAEDQAILVTGNREPLLLDTQPCFRNRSSNASWTSRVLRSRCLGSCRSLRECR